MRLLLALFAVWLPDVASAAQAECQAFVSGEDRTLTWDNEGSLAEDETYREWLLRKPGQAWDWGWGETPACPSAVVLQFLTRDLDPADASGLCLTGADDGSWVVAPGERNFRGRCRATTCEMVEAAQTEVAAVAGTIAGAVTGANVVAGAGGLTVVSHSSGLWILTGSSGYIAGTIGTVSTGVLGVLTAPFTATVAAVSVVVVGGAMYVCAS